MSLGSNDTLLCKIALGSYGDFITSETAVETVEGISSYFNEVIEWHEVYRLIRRRYSNWEIAYNNIDDFLAKLWEKIEIYTPSFMLRRKRFIEYLLLPDDELLVQSESIQNFVDHTDTEVDDPLGKPLKNVTNQNSSRQYGDKLQRLRQQINGANSNLIEEYLNRFKTLFIRATTKAEYYN